MGDCTIDRWVDVGRTMKTQNVFMEISSSLFFRFLDHSFVYRDKAPF